MTNFILSKISRNMYCISLGTILLCLCSCQKKEEVPPTPVQNTINIISEDATLAEHLKTMNVAKLLTPEGKSIMSVLAITPQEQERGLSGVRPEQWPSDHAMLFLAMEDSYRTFWMPDTYFDLDIFFLDKDLKIVAIERKIQHHPGRENESTIPRTRSYLCRHVMEMNSSSSVSLSLNVGDKISWMESVSLDQIVSNTLQKK